MACTSGGLDAGATLQQLACGAAAEQQGAVLPYIPTSGHDVQVARVGGAGLALQHAGLVGRYQVRKRLNHREHGVHDGVQQQVEQVAGVLRVARQRPARAAANRSFPFLF